jgi:hypothetical protein
VDTSDTRRRIQLIALVAAGSILLLTVVLLVAFDGFGDDGGIRIGAGSLDDPALLPGEMLSDLDPVSGQAAPAQDSVAEFTRKYGEPPGTDYARLRIPVLGVDAPVGLYIVDGPVMPEPQGPVDVAFYDLSGWTGLGGYPGGGSNAVFGAHVDLNRSIAYADGAHYRGPAVFWGLDRLRPGDVIEVVFGGEALRYAVTWLEEVDASDATNWYPYWTSNVQVDSITLFTCGGAFDRSTFAYSHRIMVRAERV